MGGSMAPDALPESSTRTTVWPASNPWGALGHRLLGLGFLALVTVLLAASVGAYDKIPQDLIDRPTWVTLYTDHTGLQLDRNADVKLRGVLVGQVRDVTADGTRAKLRLAIDPDQIGHIPANITAVMLPKTLFGEKYVSLLAPSTPSSTPIATGATIHQDTSASAIELENVLNDILPLLQAVQPDKLSSTLTALATALQGRGQQIGNTVVTLDSYLAALNQQMPTIQSDVRKLADVLDVYNGSLPDLLTILRNLTVTSSTLTQQQANLQAFLDDTTDLADTAQPFLVQHAGRLNQLGQLARPVLDVLATYAPQYPCLTAGIVTLQHNIEGAFDTGRLHITLEITRDNGKYITGQDEPANAADLPPYCAGLPNDAPVPAPETQIASGYDYGAPHGGVLTPLPEFPIVQPPTTAPGSGPHGEGSGAGLVDAPMGYAGTAEERDLIKPLVAAATGQNVDQVGDIADLLWGPLMRGAVVSTR
jgi:phospholipid/cholesterol/gamma-HCH transport system substrate-binding protein